MCGEDIRHLMTAILIIVTCFENIPNFHYVNSDTNIWQLAIWKDFVLELCK